MTDDPCMNGTVTIRLMGGLGNQMFQYAAALGLAMRQGKALMLDISHFEADKTRPYYLCHLKVPQDIDTSARPAKPVSNSITARVIRRIKRSTCSEGVYREPHFHFDPALFSLSGVDIRLNGYFQSPHYFDKVEELLRERFQPKAPLSVTAADWASRIAASPRSISLHVRRGDYLKAPYSAVHTALDRGYYDRAVDLIQDLAGEAEFFLFSDEPDFIAETFADLPRSHVVRSDPTAPWEDMFLMARCQHNIIANSSYSWWGAWPNPAVDKRVIAPARWFTPDELAARNALDLYPDNWILLK